MVQKIAVLIVAYLVGSIPTALIYSRHFHNQDIRTLGDGNMGASNIKRVYGTGAGNFVALLDILKGILAMIIAVAIRFPVSWQLAAGGAAILGHDFPVFAKFRGGQGLATTAGVFLVLFPVTWIIGCVVFGLIYMLSHHSNLAKGFGMGVYALLVFLWGTSLIVIVFIVVVLLFIPFKQWLDKPRRIKIKADKNDMPTGKNG